MDEIVADLVLQCPAGTDALGPQWKVWMPAGVPPYVEFVGGSFSGTLTIRGAMLTFSDIGTISAH